MIRRVAVSLALVACLIAADTSAPFAADAVDFALAQLNKEYSSGATGPDKFDCSGLTQTAYTRVGIPLPRTAKEQSEISFGERVSSNFRRGDLLFYATGDDPRLVSHVGIYVGDGKWISAQTPKPPPNGRVILDDITNSWWSPRFLYGLRIATTPPSTPPTPTSQYDGRWSAIATGTSSVSTPARVEISFDVSGNRITNVSFPWRIDTRPGTTQSPYCSGNGRGGDVTISDGLFLMTGSDRFYSVRISGAFSGLNTVTGVAQFTRQSAAEPWCESATIAWSGTKR